MGVKKAFDKRLGVELSRLGFGVMRMPTLENGRMDWELGARMIDRAYEEGVNYFDTAYPYHDGESKIFLAETLRKYPRDSYYFATKLPTWLCHTSDDVEKYFNEQFTDCKMDYFDFFLIHGLNADRYDTMVRIGMYDYLTEQKKSGRIKHLGFSYHGDHETLRKLAENFKWDFVMIQINYVDDVMLGMREMYEILLKHDIPCFVMEPVRGGFLAKLPQEAQDELDRFGGEKLSPAAWALRWAMDKDNMPVILSGMSNMEQVEENLRVFSDYPAKLTGEESAMLDRVRDTMLGLKTVPCTFCHYCMDCPFGVDIPQMFEYYNRFKLFPNTFRAGIDYASLASKNKDYSACTGCGACSPLCPQGIDIPKALEQVDKEMRPLMPK